MYRDSDDTFVREIQELRAENDRLRTDLATVLRLARPRRWMRMAGVIALLALLAAATCVSELARASAALDAQSRKALNEVCWTKVAAQSRELARASTRFQGRGEVETLKHAIDECRYRNWGWEGVDERRCAALVWNPDVHSEMPWDTCVCR
jgi:hypothetical protein